MGLFKDFKDDFSQSVNEIASVDEKKNEKTTKTIELDVVKNKMTSESTDLKSELSKLDGLLEQVNEQEKKNGSAVSTGANKMNNQSRIEENPLVKNNEERIEDDRTKSQFIELTGEASDDVSVITTSTTLVGDIQTTGSFDIQGQINGNVACNGKLNVTGTIIGNSNSAEFFSDAAKVEGEIVSTGTVKIGAGSVIIGNISATSAVIAGAVKGDIDVQGPVVVDTSAVVMGNIKSRTVQINNGAVIEGFCSQTYAELDVQGLFGVN
ncbi:polymer-forming cytoskeletal protein [Lachnobacterium bovis]|uniref:Polymer-forming protein n=1 Tax=Lachnobacterium bovis TaxID=140626 RepID=A0A1H9QIC2_9FIRM|nr:polymer-forming cytoskeletal protein [Lachnobacterium bovis]SER60178.1 Polymer-forming protein [Lachnobacterium bovis]